MGKWSLQPLNVKSRKCRICRKRKPIDDFYDQNEKIPPYKRQLGIRKRTECKCCHYEQTKNLMNKTERFNYNIFYYMANKMNKSVTQKIKDLLNNGKTVNGTKAVALGAGDTNFLNKRVAEFRKKGMNIETILKKGKETAYKLKKEEVA